MRKKKILKFKDRMLFKTIFFSNFGISTLIIIIACLISFRWFQESTEQNNIDKEHKIIANMNTVIENYFHSAELTLETLSKNVYMKQFLMMDQSDWNDNMSIVARSIFQTVSANPKLHSIYIIGTKNILLKSGNTVLSNRVDTIVADSFRNSFQKPFSTFKYQQGSTTYHILSFGLGDFTKKNTYSNGICVNLDMEKISEEIFPKTDVNERYIVIDKQGTVIASTDPSFSFGQDISDEDFIPSIVLNKGKSDSFAKNYKDIKYLITYNYSLRNGFYIVHMLPYSNFVAPILQVRNLVIILGILFGFISIGISMALTLWIYRPINQVVDHISAIQPFNHFKEKGSKNSEITIISNAISDMVLRLNNFNKEKEVSEIITYFHLRQTGTQLPDSIRELFQNIHQYCVLLMRICDAEEFIKSNTDEALHFQIKSMTGIMDNYLSASGNCNTYIMDNEYMACILSSEEILPDQDTLLASANKLLLLIRDMIHVDINIGISSIYDNLDQLKQAYQIAKVATNHRYLFGKNTCISEDQVHACALNGDYSFNLKPLIQTLKALDFNLFERQFKELLEYTKSHSLQTAQELILSFAYAMFKYENELKNGTIDISKYEEIKETLLSYQYIDDTYQWFHNYFNDISENITKMNSIGTNELIISIVKFIHENYSDVNLNAGYISSKYNITASYFSRIFKEYTNCAFPDYLTNIRLERGCELLINEPSKSIQEICEMVGYSSSSYFTSLFKKKYGIPPTKYRLMKNLEE